MRSRRCRLLFPAELPSLLRAECDFPRGEPSKAQPRVDVAKNSTYRALEGLFAITKDGLNEVAGSASARRSYSDIDLEERCLSAAAMRHGAKNDAKMLLGRVDNISRKVLPFRWRWQYVHKNAMAYALQAVLGSSLRLPIKDDKQKDSLQKVVQYALRDTTKQAYYRENKSLLDIRVLQKHVERDVFDALSRAFSENNPFDRMESLETMPVWALESGASAAAYAPLGSYLSAIVTGFFALLREWGVAFPADSAVPLLLRGVVRHAIKLELDLHTALPSCKLERRIPREARADVKALIEIFKSFITYPIEMLKPVNRQFDVMCYYLAIEVRALRRRRNSEGFEQPRPTNGAAAAMQQLVFTGICEVNTVLCRLGGVRDVISSLNVLVKMLSFDTLARMAEEKRHFTQNIIQRCSAAANPRALQNAIRQHAPAESDIRVIVRKVADDVFDIIADCIAREAMSLFPTLSEKHLQTHMLTMNAKPAKMRVYYPIQIEPGAWAEDYASPYRHISVPITTGGSRCSDPDSRGNMRKFLNYIGGIPFRLDRASIFVQEEGLRQGFAFDRVPAAFGVANSKSVDEHNDVINQRGWMKTVLSNLQHSLNIERFHVPHQLDFRGRVYPLPQMFSIASIRQFRSLLRFADAVPLGSAGFDWLKIHAANMYGLTKRSFTERVAFVNEHMDLIQRCAKAPFSENFHFWAEGENALEFLAACQELDAAIESGCPESFPSSLPVQVDGSANGLQHYSAISRDPLGAAAVNMTPTETPQDVYTHVLAEMLKFIERDAADGVRAARLILGDGTGLNKKHLKRSTIKRAIMTQVYGVTQHGMRKMIENELRSQNAVHLLWARQDIIELAGYLQKQLSQSLGIVFARSDEARSWLKNTAALAYSIQPKHMRQPIQFTTPLGFRVVLPYQKQRKRAVYDYAGGVVLIPEYLGDPSSKCITSFSANFIHSFDATHLAMTALEMQRRNLQMTSVHDCFWCHAANMDTLSAITREQFVKLYTENDPLTKLHSDWTLKYARELQDAGLYFPPPPAKGSYNLEKVLKAKYFFA